MTWPRVRDWLIVHRVDLAEVGFMLLALVGLALLTSAIWSLLAGGVLGVVACERASSVGAALKRAEKRHLERAT